MLEDKKEIKEFIELLPKYAQNEKYTDINSCLLAENLNFDVCSLYNYILFNFSINDSAYLNIMYSTI